MAVFGMNIEEKPWYYALGVGRLRGRPRRGSRALVLLQADAGADRGEEGGARRPQPGDPEGPRRGAQAVAVPRGGQAARARARQAPPDPSLEAQHRGADQADRDAHAAGRLHAEEVHPGRVRPEGVLRGVADRHPGRGHVPQPGALLRPDEPLLAHRQRRRAQDQRAERRAAASRSPRASSRRRSSTPATRPGWPRRERGSRREQCRRADSRAPRRRGPRQKAQTLKERAEGRGAE